MLECWHALPSSTASCIEFVSWKCISGKMDMHSSPQYGDIQSQSQSNHNPSNYLNFVRDVIRVQCSFWFCAFVHFVMKRMVRRMESVLFSALRCRVFGRKSKEDPLIASNRIISFAHQIEYSVSAAKLSSSMAVIETEPPSVLC